MLTVIAALITTGLRSRRDPAWRGALAAVALAGVAALATQGLQAGLPANVAYPALTLIAAVAAWLAASRAAGVSVGRLRGGASGPGGPAGGGGDPGYGGDDSLDLYRDGYRHFDDSAAFAAYVNSGYGETGGLPAARPTAIRPAVRAARRVTGTRADSRRPATRVPGASSRPGRGLSRRPGRAGHRGLRPAVPAERVPAPVPGRGARAATPPA